MPIAKTTVNNVKISNLLERIEVKLPDNYIIRSLHVDDYEKGNNV